MNAPLRLPRAAARLLALVTLAVLSSPLARADGFVLDSGSPSGGTATGSSSASQYVTNGDSRGGNAYGIGADSCSGPLRFSWHWSGPGPAPASVVLKVETAASWTGPPGACDDGLGQNDPKSDSYAGPTLVSQTQRGTSSRP